LTLGAASFVAEIEVEIVRIAARPSRFPARADLAPGLRAARHARYLISSSKRLEKSRSSALSTVRETCRVCWI